MSIIERIIEEFEKNWSRWNIEGRCSNSVYLINDNEMSMIRCYYHYIGICVETYGVESIWTGEVLWKEV